MARPDKYAPGNEREELAQSSLNETMLNAGVLTFKEFATREPLAAGDYS